VGSKPRIRRKRNPSGKQPHFLQKIGIVVWWVLFMWVLGLENTKQEHPPGEGLFYTIKLVSRFLEMAKTMLGSD